VRDSASTLHERADWRLRLRSTALKRTDHSLKNGNDRIGQRVAEHRGIPIEPIRSHPHLQAKNFL